jgi:hypothetical protein
VLVVVAVGAVTWFVTDGSSRTPRLVGEGPAPPTFTGARNEMGMPVIATPGAASGAVSAGGVEVSGADWALGRVPLDVAVRPEWTLTNVGRSYVTLGAPHAEVLAGCCPGPFALSDPSLAPGQRATLTFELSMHPGMDGWHDMLVHVPVSSEDGDDVLTLGVEGDFRN